MCISCEMHDKWPPFIEFTIWFLLQGMSVGNHFGVWIVSKTLVVDITKNLYGNATIPNITMENTTTTTLSTNLLSTLSTLSTNLSTTVPNISTTLPTIMNITNETKLVLLKTPTEQWVKLLDFRMLLLAFCGIGAALYLVHVTLLLPNIIQSFRVADPLSLKETGGGYFQNLLKIHCVMLILETIIFDIPAGCITMETLTLIWDGPIIEDEKMKASKTIIALSLIGLAFIALYKGK